MTTKAVKASDLKTGDIVLTHGLRVRLNEVKQAPAHDQQEDLIAEGLSPMVTWSVGTVLNAEEAVKDGFPNGYLGTAADGTRTWQVQSNDRCPWAVEV